MTLPSKASRVSTTTRSPGRTHHGEPARLELDARRRPKALWIGGTRLLLEAAHARELGKRYGSK